MNPPAGLAAMSDEDLFGELRRLVAAERESTVRVLLLLAEVDRRRAVEQTATPSLFVFCVEELGYSEGAAYRRIHAARCARAFPRVYVLLRRGRITLTTVSMLAPHLTQANHRALLRRACGLRKFEVERLVAGFTPRPAPRESIRAIVTAAPAAPGTLAIFAAASEGPTPAPEGPASAPDGPAPGEDAAARSAEGAPPASSLPEPPPAARRVEFRFTAGEAFLAKLERARDVLWHKFPAGRLEDVLDDALESLLERRDPGRRIARLEARRAARAARTAPGGTRPSVTPP